MQSRKEGTNPLLPEFPRTNSVIANACSAGVFNLRGIDAANGRTVMHKNRVQDFVDNLTPAETRVLILHRRCAVNRG